MDKFFIYINLSFILTAVLTYPVILALKNLKSLQLTREEGPETHHKKSGTPTMGGISFLIIVSILGLIFMPGYFYPIISLFIGFGLIGFADDILKILRKQNLGLTASQKFILQILTAAAFSIYVVNANHLLTTPSFLKYVLLDNYWLYLCFSVFVIVGGANAANLTDGLDGLLSGSALIAFICFGVILLNQLFSDLALFAFIIAAALLGFLFYNYPRENGALIFMGDVGSLPIGAVLSGIAIITHNELILIVIGGLFIIETLSVIIQVASFKAFKRRVLRMSPLHHHFELLGWSEPRVVALFWQISLVFGLTGILFIR